MEFIFPIPLLINQFHFLQLLLHFLYFFMSFDAKPKQKLLFRLEQLCHLRYSLKRNNNKHSNNEHCCFLKREIMLCLHPLQQGIFFKWTSWKTSQLITENLHYSLTTDEHTKSAYTRNFLPDDSCHFTQCHGHVTQKHIGLY